MKLLHGFHDAASYQQGVVSIGNFDGVHRGHQQIINQLVQRAHAAQVPAVVFTFDPHPVTLLRPELAPPSLSTLSRKAELIGRCGADVLIAYPTNPALLNLTPDEFFSQIIRGELNASGLVEGENFYFGHNRAGDVETLKNLAADCGMTVDVVTSLKLGERVVSSSVIRQLVTTGQIAEAVELLGHPYQVQGTVAKGAERGRTIGFPTANLTQIKTVLPQNGVYGGLAYAAEASFPAAIHIGPNPTFDDEERKFEVHLVGYAGDLYGTEVKVDFLDRIRDIRTFGSSDELQQQLERDVDVAVKLANLGGRG